MKSLIQLMSERFGFLVTAVQPTINKVNRRLNIHIPDMINPVIEKDARKELEESNQWRWAAGGCGFILALKDQRVLVTILRDEKAPSYQGYNTLASGLSTCVEELLNPELIAYREGYEEIQIFLTNGQRLVPELGQTTWNDGVEYLPANVPTHDITPIQNVWQIEISASLIPEGFFCYSMLNFDEATGSIDILKAIEIDLRLYSLDEIIIRDGELDGKFDRRIELFKIERNGTLGKILATFQGGKRIPDKNGREIFFTPVLQEIVNSLKQ